MLCLRAVRRDARRVRDDDCDRVWHDPPYQRACHPARVPSGTAGPDVATGELGCDGNESFGCWGEESSGDELVDEQVQPGAGDADVSPASASASRRPAGALPGRCAASRVCELFWDEALRRPSQVPVRWEPCGGSHVAAGPPARSGSTPSYA
eukprot:364896-Chlamydomonas_euryale.AAC.3